METELQKLFNEFIRDYQFSAKRSQETIRGYKSCFNLFIKLNPEATLESLNRSTITSFFEQMENRERFVGRSTIKKGVKLTTVATYRSKLNKFFTWLIANNYIKQNPFDGIPYPEVKYTDKKFLSQSEVDKIFASAWLSTTPFLRKRNTALVKILLYCGLRRNEAINLMLDDVCLDFGKESIRVRPETSKSKVPRYIPLHSDAIVSLSDYLTERSKLKYTTPYLFVSNNHDNKLTLAGAKHLVLVLKKKSGVDFHLHRLRHTFAMNSLNMGIDSAKLTLLMGHKNQRMLLTYLRCMPPEAMRGDIEKINRKNLL